MARTSLFAAGLVLALVALQATARPGGGNSYSGGSSSGGSSSSRGGGSSGSSGGSSSFGTSSGSSRSSGSTSFANANPLVRAVTLGFFGFVFVALVLMVGGMLSRAQRQLDTGGREPAKPTPRTDIRDAVLEFVRKHDPDFSLVLFEDFANTLYAESQRARHDPSALAALAPYWTPEQLAALSKRGPEGGRVQAVVVGSLWPENASKAAGQLRIRCSFEANLHLQLAPTRVPSHLTQYVEEAWIFSRDLTVKTRPWAGVRKLGCPSCGAPFRSTVDARCESCGQASGGGRFDWQVSRVTVGQVETREHSLTGTAEEVGSDFPTRFAPLMKERRDHLFRDDPGVNPASLGARLRLIYETLQPAWVAQDLRRVRPFVSDRLYAYLQYWIDAYREQGLRNVLEGPRLQRFVIVRVERDAHYDAITMRVGATGCDYTVEQESGRVVGGSRSKERRYSEYWTLVRSAKVRGVPRLDKNCPACGAPLSINMAGKCEYCSAHVTSGEFDWVLSKIEQDEAYRG